MLYFYKKGTRMSDTTFPPGSSTVGSELLPHLKANSLHFFQPKKRFLARKNWFQSGTNTLLV